MMMKTPDYMDELIKEHNIPDDDDDDFSSGFQFRPARHVVSQQSRISSTLENYGSMDHVGHGKSGCKDIGGSEDSALISVIDRKMNQHFGNLLHAVEGLSARLSQLETRLHRLENSVDDLKDATEVNHGRTDGKLRQLENILREVESGMLDLKDKQEISEAQLQLAKLQMLKDHQKLENRTSNVQSASAQGVSSSAPHQSRQPQLTHVACQQLPSLPPSVSPTQQYQLFPPAPTAQLPTQPPHNQIPSQQADSTYPPPVLNSQPTPQTYYMPQVQQSQPPPTAPYQTYPPAPHLSPTSQSHQLPQQHPPLNAVDPLAQFSSVHNPGETPDMLSQSYPPSYPPSFHKNSNAPALALPSQQHPYVGSIQYPHDQPTSNHYPEFPHGNMQPVQQSNFDDFYSHNGSPSHNSGSNMGMHSQFLPASSVRSGESSFSRLPTAQVLPHAVPMASAVDKESGSSGTGNRIPIDNVIDKVVAMGFRRDVVRATVKKMTENGQSVDLNVVLDKLMNNGEVQSQSGGFGR